MTTEDTIAAISTPVGEGAVSVIRISGPEAISVSDRIFSGARLLRDAPARFVQHGRILDNGAMVDEALVTVFRSPASYTGEDVVEISGHGGVLVSARILSLLLASGARAADPGEFTQRAFLNGKLDLTQAEAVMDLIRAQTPLALRAAAEQLEGRIGAEIEAMRGDLLSTLAHIEAFIDFPDEGIDPDTGASLLDRVRALRERVEQLLSTAEEGRIFREGVKLAICGRPNAGKSSVLNRLVGFDRAIVSAAPGTTRDTIEECINLRGVLFRVIDTAGIRDTENEVEHEGVERARSAIQSAEIVLHVVDAGVGDFCPAFCEAEILAANKTDLSFDEAIVPDSAIRLSCLTGEGFDKLVGALVDRVSRPHQARRTSFASINARHNACLLRANEALGASAIALENEMDSELVAVDLRIALDSLGEIVGKIGAEDILGEIFSTFCIGK